MRKHSIKLKKHYPNMTYLEFLRLKLSEEVEP